MGNVVSGATPVVINTPLESYLDDLTLLGEHKTLAILGNTRFFKTIRAKNAEGRIIVKFFVKPEPSFQFGPYIDELNALNARLSGIINVLPPVMVRNSNQAGFIVRQDIFASLSERINTRPFLTKIEKVWITYQLLSAIAEVHARECCHGDIKTENVLVTSWNWVYLTDFASTYKPTKLQDDYPADFSFFFDTTGRRTCYLAPERFYHNDTSNIVDYDDRPNEPLKPEMDIFSIGCVIAELFLEGTRLFDLSELLRYRNGDYDPQVILQSIDDVDIRNMIIEMIDLNPTKRASAAEYLNRGRGTIFPVYFQSFLHMYIFSITDPQNSLFDGDARIERMSQDFDKIAFFMGILPENQLSPTSPKSASVSLKPPAEFTKASSLCKTITPRSSGVLNNFSIDIRVNIPNFTMKPEHSKLFNGLDDNSRPKAIETSLLFVSLIVSNIRNLRHPSSKLLAIDMLLVFGTYLPDVLKLDRIVPYLCTLFNDQNPVVRLSALRVVTQLTASVEEFDKENLDIFPEYLFSQISKFSNDSSTLVLETYAKCIVIIAETAQKFLEAKQSFRFEEDSEVADGYGIDGLVQFDSYDKQLNSLQNFILEEVLKLMTIDPSVSRVLLFEITKLCVFLGRHRAEIILSHLATYLNGPDWQLKCALFESIVGIGTFVGDKAVESYILPLMQESLFDEQESVVSQVLSALTSLTELGLFSRITLRGLVERLSPLLCHPARCVRYGCVAFISALAKRLPPVEAVCYLLPIIRPFLTRDLADINEETLLASLKKPLLRAVYDQAQIVVKMAINIRDRTYSSSQESTSSLGSRLTSRNSVQTGFGYDDSSMRNVELGDDELLDKIRNIGMDSEDEKKIIALRQFLFRGKARSLTYQTKPNTSEESEDPIVCPGKDFQRKMTLAAASPQMPQNSTVSEQSKTRKFVHRRNESTGSTSSVAQAALQDALSSSPQRGSMTRKGSESHRATSPPPIPSSKETRSSSVTSVESNSAARPLSSPSIVTATATIQSPVPSTAGNIIQTSSTTLLSTTVAVEKTTNYVIPLRAIPNSTLGSMNQRRMLMYTSPIQEMGLVQSLRQKKHRRQQSKSNTTSNFSLPQWRPDGLHVAHFMEHKGSVNFIAVSPDSLYFLTASDDGTIKVWDTNRMDKNVSNKSRLTYNPQSGSITGLVFAENTSSFLFSTSNGLIQLCRVDYQLKPNENVVSSLRCICLREFKLEEGHAVALDHYSLPSGHSIVVYASSRGLLCGFDLRTGKSVWEFTVPANEGVVSTIMMDRKRQFVVCGTNRGIVKCFDLRFSYPVTTFPIGLSCVHALLPYPSPTKSSWIICAGAVHGEISVWDIERGDCVQVYGMSVREIENWWKDYKTIQQSWKRSSSSIVEDIERNISSLSKIETTIRAVLSCGDTALITAGKDSQLYYWDIQDVSRSFVIGDRGGTATTSNFRRVEDNGVTFFVEDFSNTNSLNSATASSNGYNSKQVRARGMVSSSNVRHTDLITGVGFADSPFPMIISVGRDGVVRIWK